MFNPPQFFVLTIIIVLDQLVIPIEQEELVWGSAITLLLLRKWSLKLEYNNNKRILDRIWMSHKLLITYMKVMKHIYIVVLSIYVKILPTFDNDQSLHTHWHTHHY
jgi:hypothetical protein